MIIDTHLHPTNLVDEAWRHTGTPFNGERMLKLMDGPYMINGKPRRIDMGFIQPPPGNTGYRDGNRMGRDGIRDYMAYCAELCQKYPDRFIGNFNYNPRWGPENGALELEFHVKEYGFKMLKLHTNMHGYRPDRALDWLRPAMKMCAKYNVVVLIHTGDGPYSIPTQFYPIIREFPMVQFIIGHFGVQTGGNYSFEAFWMAMDTPNVVCESGWCFQSRIVEFAKELPRHKIVFGTDSPPNEPGMWLRELEVLCQPPPQGMAACSRPRGSTVRTRSSPPTGGSSGSSRTTVPGPSRSSCWHPTELRPERARHRPSWARPSETPHPRPAKSESIAIATRTRPPTTTTAVRTIRCRSQVWIETGSCGGASSRKRSMIGRGSSFSRPESSVGTAMPTAQAKASAISSGVKRAVARS
jgi:predicted TIM-barrel fold metal-dependent hydrolase